MLSRPKIAPVDDKLILRDHPFDIVPRRCSSCRQPYLDDPFAYYSKADPEIYVMHYLHGFNCGRPECKSLNVNLLPWDAKIKYMRATQKFLKDTHLDQWCKWFLLLPEEYNGLPAELEVQCRTKGCLETRLVKARWTAHVPPRFVVPAHKCQQTKKRSNWSPKEFPVIYPNKLCQIWKAFQEIAWFDITSCPRRPDIYVDKSLTVSEQATILMMLRDQVKIKECHEAKIKEGAEKYHGTKRKMEVMELD